MLSTHRINKLLSEVNKLKQQQQTQQSKLNVLALLTRLYAGFRQKLYIENVIMADYVPSSMVFKTILTSTSLEPICHPIRVVLN
jgi:hypothetical protein